VFESGAGLQSVGGILRRPLHRGEHGKTVVETAEEAERPGELGGELGASAFVAAGVVCGLLEALGGCRSVAEVPEGVEESLADRSGLLRCPSWHPAPSPRSRRKGSGDRLETS